MGPVHLAKRVLIAGMVRLAARGLTHCGAVVHVAMRGLIVGPVHVAMRGLIVGLVRWAMRGLIVGGAGPFGNTRSDCGDGPCGIIYYYLSHP